MATPPLLMTRFGGRLPLPGAAGVSLLLGQSFIDWWEIQGEQNLGAVGEEL